MESEDVLSALTLDPPTGPWTVDEFFALPETHTKIELQDGCYIVSPSPTPRHQFVLTDLARCVGPQLPRELATAVELDITLGHMSVRRPDLSVLKRTAAAKRRAQAEDVELVVEIVSAGSSPRTDRLVKPVEYAEAGIAGFWLIELDPDLTLTAYALRDGTYVELGTWGRGETARTAVPFGVTVPIDDLIWD